MRVVVLSPHPDDETLGCGGTLALHVERGDDVRVVFVTDGELGGHGRDRAETSQIRRSEAASALAVLGVERWEWWSVPDGRVAEERAWGDRLDDLLGSACPKRVYAPHPDDDHPDHRAVAEVAAERCATAGIVLYGFEIWAPLAVMHDIVDISPVIDRKRRAIRCYASQNEHVDFESAMVGLAAYRGALHSWPGGPYAEAFRRIA